MGKNLASVLVARGLILTEREEVFWFLFFEFASTRSCGFVVRMGEEHTDLGGRIGWGVWVEAK